MLLRFLAILAYIPAAQAQITIIDELNPPAVARLSPAANGQALYISTSLTMRGEPADKRHKFLKWDSDVWRTAIRDWGEEREFQRLQEDISGRVQIYSAKFNCAGAPPFCVSSESGLVYWRDRDTGTIRHIGYGVGGVSDNGEWAVTSADYAGDWTPATFGPEIRRVRIADGRIETARAEYTLLSRLPVRRIVADTGLIAFARAGQLQLWRTGEPLTHTRIDTEFTSYVIDSRGEFLLGLDGGFRWRISTKWTNWFFGVSQPAYAEVPYRLSRLDLKTATVTPVLQTAFGVEQPDLASDGETAVFLSGADWAGTNQDNVTQVWLLNLRSGAKRQLTAEPIDVKEVAIARNGAAVFAITENLRILRIDVASGRTEEIAPEYPRLFVADPRTKVWAQGGRYWLWGRGLGDVEIDAGGAAAEIMAGGADDVEFLVPADAAIGENRVRVGAKSSPFQPFEIGASIRPVAPAFLGSSGRGPTWFHEDGVLPITAENPARLGETVTARVTGLGNTPTVFQWSLVETYIYPRGNVGYFKTPLVVENIRATGKQGELVVTVRLPGSLRGGLYRYAGIDASLPGEYSINLSLLPIFGV